ncbi:MAG: biotin carboxylase N-terminal domain-containing protein [Pseudomonadota bacterium]
MFDKILVANRGEIAVRIIRTCHQLGLATVAVYTDADAGAAHVLAAGEAVHIGASSAQTSYLCIDKLVAVAAATGCGAVHPGYGFLSENADFARAVQAAGLVFIGPDAAAIEAMGNKSRSKELMIAAGVPCVPGYQGAQQDDVELAAHALAVGLPVMVKAAAGGGGRGMRLVHEEADLAASIRAARSEALNAFGNGQLLIEKAVLGARHVEIQVFGDRHGNVLHLGERDCSIQRRHQKVVEECPSPAVDGALRARMGAAAVAAARAVNYVGAGTVEFMLAADGQFYFLEMNTRLQVEHPVTELVYDVDLVGWQLLVAQGQALPMTQDQLMARQRGWAIEVRLCSEDPAQNFMPQTGTVLAWRAPQGRVDHCLFEGAVISPFYDSMQGKLIAFGDTREQARHKLLQMLDETVLLGVHSNRDFLRGIVGHAAFGSGQFTTGFIDEHDTFAPTPVLHGPLAAALLYHLDSQVLGLDAELLGWQSSAPARTMIRFDHGAHEVQYLGGRNYRVDGDFDLTLHGIDGPWLRYSHAGVTSRASFARRGNALWLSAGGATLCYEDLTLAPADKADAGSDPRMFAPMDGKIIAVLVEPGAAVVKGQALAVLEAMKMEFSVTSGGEGTVSDVACYSGQQVKARQFLFAMRYTAPI